MEGPGSELGKITNFFQATKKLPKKSSNNLMGSKPPSTPSSLISNGNGEPTHRTKSNSAVSGLSSISEESSGSDINKDLLDKYVAESKRKRRDSITSNDSSNVFLPSASKKKRISGSSAQSTISADTLSSNESSFLTFPEDLSSGNFVWNDLSVEENNELYLEIYSIKKNWAQIIPKLSSLLKSNFRIKPGFAAQVIVHCIIKDGCRVRKEVEKEGNQFILHLIEKSEPNPGYFYELLQEIIKETGDENKNELNNSYWSIIDKSIKTRSGERGMREKPLSSLFYILTMIAEKLAAIELERKKFVTPPFALRVFQNEEHVLFNKNCKEFMKALFETNDKKKLDPEEFSLYLRWIHIFLEYFKGVPSPNIFNEAIFHLAKLASAPGCGPVFLSNIWVPSVGMALAEKMIVNKVPELRTLYGKNLHSFLREFSACGDLVDPKSMPVPDPPPRLGLHNFYSQRRVIKNGNVEKERPTSTSSSNSKSSRANYKGEIKLHKLAQSEDLDQFKREIARMKSNNEKLNTRDAFGNTVLHDLAANGRSNHLVHLWEVYLQPDNPESVDLLLAQNSNGDSALHEVAYMKEPSFSVMCSLTTIATVLGKKNELLKMKNLKMECPFNIIKARAAKGEIEEGEANRMLEILSYNSIQSLHSRNFAGFNLPSEVIDRFTSDTEIALLIGYWRNFADRQKKDLAKNEQL